MRTATRRNHRVRLLTQGLRPTFGSGLVLPVNMTENRYTGRTEGRPFDPYVGLNTGGVTHEVNSWADFSAALAAVALSATNDIIKVNVDFEIPAGSLPKVLPQRINANLRCDIVCAPIYQGTFERGARERVDGSETFMTIARGLTSNTSSEPFFTTGTPGTNLASGYRWIGLRFMVHPSQLNIPGLYLFFFGASGSSQDTTGKVPQWHIVDRCWVPGSLTCESRGCFWFGAQKWAVINSRIEHIWARASTWNDVMCIASWNAVGEFVIENNYLDSSGENVFIGGGGQKIGVNNSNGVIRRNHVTKDYALYHGMDGGGTVTIKNLLEFKQLLYGVVEDNEFDGSWHEHSNSQNGAAGVWKNNPYPSAPAPYDPVTGHLLIRGNRWRRAAIWNVLQGRTQADAPTSLFTHEVHYMDNVCDQWNEVPYNATPRAVQMVGEQLRGAMYFKHNTYVGQGGFGSGNFILFSGIDDNGVEDFAFDDNVTHYCGFGIGGPAVGGTACMDRFCQQWSVSRNAIIRAGGAVANHPSGNYWPAALSNVYDAADITARTWRVSSGYANRLAPDGYTIGVSDWDHFLNRLAGVV